MVPLSLRRCSLRSLATGDELESAFHCACQLTMAMLFPFSNVWPSFVFVMPCGVTSLLVSLLALSRKLKNAIIHLLLSHVLQHHVCG